MGRSCCSNKEVDKSLRESVRQHTQSILASEYDVNSMQKHKLKTYRAGGKHQSYDEDELLNKTLKGCGVTPLSDSMLSLDTVGHIANYFKDIHDINVSWVSEIK